MEDSTFNKTQRSFRASSEGLLSSPRSATEDGDASARRKRPRLDSGDRTYRSLSAEASSVSIDLRKLRNMARSSETGGGGGNSSDAAMEEEQQPMISPHSKVTLNIKDQSASSLTNDIQDTHEQELQEQEVNETPDSQESLSKTQSMTPQSRSPSPLGSPEIEVAEVEDATDYIGPTRWMRPGGRSIEERRSSHMETFPMLNDAEDWRHVLTKLAMAFQYEENDLGCLFEQLSSFISYWITLADESPSKIWDLWAPDSDLWNQFPSINEAIVKRNTPATIIRAPSALGLLSNEIDLTEDDTEHLITPNLDERNDKDPVLRYFKIIVVFLCRILHMDNQTLIDTAHDSAEPDLGGKPFIQLFNAYCVGGSNATWCDYVWRLYSGGRWNAEDLLNVLMKEFLKSNGLDNVAQCLIKLIERSPSDLDYAANLLMTVAGILAWACRLDKQQADLIQRVCAATSVLYSKSFVKFEEMIRKQVSGFTIEIIQRYIAGLADCLKYLCILDYRLTIKLLPLNFDHEVQKYMKEDEPFGRQAGELFSTRLRLELAFLCLKNGRMESRVAGVEAYGDVLLQIYKGYHTNKREGEDLHPYVALCKDFIQDKDLISYLVGVNSHPQVVSRSKNIIGFQVITRCYTQKDTDTIWTAMRSSQDPRRSEAIIDVLVAQLDYAETNFLETFVEKFIDLPIEAYDGKMRYFVKSVLASASSKTQRPSPFVETICIRVIIPFLQECLRHPNLSLKEKKDRWNFAAEEFQSAASRDLTSRAKNEISAMAVECVEKAGYESTAGIAILSTFIDTRYHGFEYEGQPYCTTDKFAELVVNDLGRCSTILQETGLDDEDIMEILQPRLDLIERSLQAFNAWPHKEWMESLWQNLVGNGAVNDKARDCGYRMLARLFRAAITRIDFLDACMETFFEKLGHENMTASVLDFAKEASAYYERFIRHATYDDEDYSSKPLPGNMFWYIALAAESQEVVDRAIHFFVDYNLSTALAIPPNVVEDNHVRLVDRCVAQLTGAASKIEAEQLEDVPMSDTLPESGSKAAKLQFSRSLHILKLFLTKIREKRLGSPIVRNDSPLSNHSVHGEEMVFTFHDPIGSRQVKKSLTIGSESPVKELVARLCRATGCSRIKMYAGGQPIDQTSDADTLLQDISVLKTNRHLLIQKVPGSTLLKENKSSNRLLPLEQQVLVHFDKLYELLSLNDEMGKEACNFLMTFPPKQEILSTSTLGLLPLESPYKSIYCCYVLKSKLLQGLGEGASCEEHLTMLIRGVGDALVRFVATPGGYFDTPKDTLLLHMTDCLSVALKEAVSDDVAASYFPDASAFINSIVKVLEAALQDDGNRDRVSIVYYCFAIILEATIKNTQAWEALKNHPAINDILKASWLTSTRTNVRINTTQTVKSICAVLPLKLIDTVEFLDFFWNQTLALVPSTQDYPNQSRQFFDVAMTIYIAKSEHSPTVMPLEAYVSVWSTMLLHHHPQGSSPGHDQDNLVDGLADMLAWTIQLIKSKKQVIKGTAGLLEGIFTTHVFPSNLSRDDSQKTKLHVPVLSNSTRAKLYNLMISLTSDQETFRTLVKLLKHTIPTHPERSGAWASGVAQPLEDQSDAPWIIEREKIVRTSAGYAGLKNLSNTCYLNSLFMQLFMNVRFRDFMLHVNTIDPGKTQVLLHETQRLFAYLQETWLKSVDPSNVVENIMTFDGDPIDVHVQMDVDEFYNLLFDRLENQIMSPEDKKTFRSFYGGELVQQIKSQDCPHVSERFEPFSVIQCEIQGKSGLTESLNAFIEGEMMQGDNKYKCSSCETYVNAIKRACLKHVPDNLIFHLKRFDYDLVHGTRNKINDQFEFPMELDMAPYNVEYLKDPRGTPTPDMFMLVGILVHSGTAEIGHYYSYVRERPGIQDTWVEMNDSDVSTFDPANIPSSCFGGWDSSGHPAWPKTYNAYMLFYQRIETMREDSVSYPTERNHPVQTEIPTEVLSQLVSENELWVRKYCLLDQSFVKFSRDVLEKYRDLFQGQCTDSHILEASLIHGTIRQIELIFARVKDCRYLDDLLRSFERILRKCNQCTALFLKAITSKGTFRNLLFRCPHDMVRQKLADEIFHGLSLLKEHEPRLYDADLGSPASCLSQDEVIQTYGIFQEVLRACDHIVETIPLLSKGWDDFWSFMGRLGLSGPWELAQLQEHDYFTKTLQIIAYNGGLQQVPDWNFANNYNKSRARKRYVMTNLVSFFVMVFRGIVENTAGSGSGSGSGSDDKYDRIQLGNLEQKLLMHSITTGDQKGRAPANVILAGVLSFQGLDTALYRGAMDCFMRYNDQPNALRLYQTALLKGTSVSPASASASYLSAASAYIENCPDDRSIHLIVNRFAEGVHTIGDEAGQEHLLFFNQLRFAYNPNFPHYQPPFLKQVVTKKLYIFVPHLICYHESEVRRNTAAMVNALIFDLEWETMDDEQQAEEFVKIGKHLTIECLNKLTGIIDARKLFDIKRLDYLIDIIRAGVEKYCDEETEDEDDNMLRAKFEKYLDAVPNIAANSPEGVESADYSDSDELTDASMVPNKH